MLHQYGIFCIETVSNHKLELLTYIFVGKYYELLLILNSQNNPLGPITSGAFKVTRP